MTCSFLFSSEGTYRSHVEMENEEVELEIADTAGEVQYYTPCHFVRFVLFWIFYFGLVQFREQLLTINYPSHAK